MSDIYVFDSMCEDFTSFGLVGALTPTSCVFEEEANGISEITMEHPLDGFGRYTALVRGNLLMVNVPVRTTPEINGTNIVTTVEKWTVKPATHAAKDWRTLWTYKGNKAKRIAVLPAGCPVTVTHKPDEGLYKVKCQYGTGWIDPGGLDYVTTKTIADNSQSIESVEPAWTVKPQIFRIYNVRKDMTSVTVSARHIFYDLLYNMTSYANTGAASCATALKALIGNSIADHDFEAFTNMVDTRTGLNWKRVNPVNALLDPETGLTALFDAALVRDNWDIFILNDPGLNRGVTVEYAKNMLGIKYEDSDEEVVTRIIPLGENKDGTDLLLAGTAYVDSPYINSYPIPHIQTLKCKDCKVGTDGVTAAIARARMRDQALAVFAGGGDLPEISLSVDFVSLGDTAEYAQYKNLDRLFLWDYVTVRHARQDIDVTARIVSIKWNCLTERMDSMEVGSVGKTLANTGINTWQIPSGFSGSKIAGGTIGSAALMADIISARHLQADSVNTEALQAGSVTAKHIVAGVIAAEAITAVKAALNEITADTIETNELYAAIAHIFELAADSIEAGDIETDELAAVMAQIGTANIKRANISYAQIVDIFSERIFTDAATVGKFRADNLEVTQAQIVDLIVGSFRLVSGDGKVYNVTIDAEGNLKTEYLYDEAEWMENGEIPDGFSAVAGSLTVGDVTAGNLYVSGAAEIMKLTAKWLAADQAWINELTAGLIQSDLGERLNLYSNEAIVGIVETNNETQNDMTILSTRFEQTTERFELEINSKVGAEDLRHYLRYQAGTAELGGSNNRYKLQAAANGVFILQDNDVMTRMEQNTVAAPVFDVGRMLRFAPHEIKVSASGVLLFN